MKDEVVVPDEGELVRAGDESKVIGNFVLLFRSHEKSVAKVTGYCDGPDDLLYPGHRRVAYTILKPPDEGREFTAQLDSSQMIRVFKTEAGAIRRRELDD